MARRRQVKVTNDNWLSVNPFQLDALTVEELRRKAAKQANQRLVRLERRKASTGERLSEFSTAQYAYEQIEKIRAGADKPSKSKKIRFREQSLPMGESQARMELYALQNFLSDERSKAGKAARYVSKTQQAFEERGISSASFKSFYNFLNSAAFATLKEAGFNSDDVVEIYNKAHEEGNSFKWINETINAYLADREQKDEELSFREFANALGVQPW